MLGGCGVLQSQPLESTGPPSLSRDHASGGRLRCHSVACSYACAKARTAGSANGGPLAAAKGFIADNLFVGQSAAFLEQFLDIASEAEAAERGDEF